VALACALLGWVAFDYTDRPVGELRAEDPPAESDADARASASESSAGSTASEKPTPAKELALLRKEQRELRAALAALRPRGAYVVVDRANNRIYLRRGDTVVVEAVVSTGSGAILRETGGQQRSWTFDTPAGRFKVLAERPDPVWTKPDWAFLEEGKPIPTRISERREYGSLGEYALDLGDGYMIHGTLYERLLGRSVTHGCVRVGRDALRTIARATGPGSQVFIY
jgi:L,D-transpeptidase YbiS